MDFSVLLSAISLLDTATCYTSDPLERPGYLLATRYLTGGAVVGMEVHSAQQKTLLTLTPDLDCILNTSAVFALRPFPAANQSLLLYGVTDSKVRNALYLYDAGAWKKDAHAV